MKLQIFIIKKCLKQTLYLSNGNIDFVLKKGKKYYPQVFLKERKYIEEERMVIRSEELKMSANDSGRF